MSQLLLKRLSKYLLIVDDREHQVIPHFAECFPKTLYKVNRINNGDYCVVRNGKIIIIIERKTWKDLASSFGDGRIENVNNLLKVREQTGCAIYYLIEGNPCPSRTRKIGRIPYKNLRAHLDHLMMRDNIHVIHSKSVADTVVRLKELIINYESLSNSVKAELESEHSEHNTILVRPEIKMRSQSAPRDKIKMRSQSAPRDKIKMRSQSATGKTRALPKIIINKIKKIICEPVDDSSDSSIDFIDSNGLPEKKKGACKKGVCEKTSPIKTAIDILKTKNTDPKKDEKNLWKSVKSVGTVVSSALMNKYHISDLILKKICLSELADMKAGSNVIGKARANKIICDKSFSAEKMLQCVTGISKTAAVNLCKIISLEKLCAGEYSATELSNIKKINNKGEPGRRIGPVVAKRLLDTFKPEIQK
jgi:ERCC4-type nuclease